MRRVMMAIVNWPHSFIMIIFLGHGFKDRKESNVIQDTITFRWSSCQVVVAFGSYVGDAMSLGGSSFSGVFPDQNKKDD